ncbi:hypothetical protein EYF80_037344 [Liparis tanakae]|uniref:Uncharacterized protein n=1 Tax=Liparis tanakae TaxID=230148 RepID=A0A4Z2GI36_9TELE|nr:hypothetical protein EYF80_037344 [Liparis tanakae]
MTPRAQRCAKREVKEVRGEGLLEEVEQDVSDYRDAVNETASAPVDEIVMVSVIFCGGDKEDESQRQEIESGTYGGEDHDMVNAPWFTAQEFYKMQYKKRVELLWRMGVISQSGTVSACEVTYSDKAPGGGVSATAP